MGTEKSADTKTELNYNNWVDNYSDYLFSYALMKVGKREDAEDLLQEPFLSALKGKENFRGEATEKPGLQLFLKIRSLITTGMRVRNCPLINTLTKPTNRLTVTFLMRTM